MTMTIVSKGGEDTETGSENTIAPKTKSSWSATGSGAPSTKPIRRLINE